MAKEIGNPVDKQSDRGGLKTGLLVMLVVRMIVSGLWIARWIHDIKSRPDGIKGLRNQRGWILVDSIIGIAVTTIALVLIMALYVQVSNSTVAARSYQNAVYIAQQQLENLRQYDGTATIRNYNGWNTTQEIDNVQYQIRIESVTPAESLDAQIVPYRVTVSWTDSKRANSIKTVNYYYSD